MNERLKELAEQAGVSITTLGATYTYGKLPEILEHFAELVRQDEREACAKFVEDEAFDEYLSGRDCANAIRQRGEK